MLKEEKYNDQCMIYDTFTRASENAVNAQTNRKTSGPIMFSLVTEVKGFRKEHSNILGLIHVQIY